MASITYEHVWKKFGGAQQFQKLRPKCGRWLQRGLPSHAMGILSLPHVMQPFNGSRGSRLAGFSSKPMSMRSMTCKYSRTRLRRCSTSCGLAVVATVAAKLAQDRNSPGEWREHGVSDTIAAVERAQDTA